ncbi:hypothetical protein A8C56_07820 [Niabella ginsenosidivorans]|uniref:Uncharacterized protein n=1 Tax=Niabella ginsenosidivorans TaxID=1176587 RepID=A0A1A9I1G9_9BACT|nr:hypothetical protein [Niabella ginsenosidivorans]ANH80899.1 hypothetical protein A8C56_07820 [Niabella ginsenosidivorans]
MFPDPAGEVRAAGWWRISNEGFSRRACYRPVALAHTVYLRFRQRRESCIVSGLFVIMVLTVPALLVQRPSFFLSAR